MKGGECDKNGLNFCLVAKGFFYHITGENIYYLISTLVYLLTFSLPMFYSSVLIHIFISLNLSHIVMSLKGVILSIIIGILQLRLAALSYCNMRFFRSYKLMAVWIDKYVMFKVLQICNIPHSLLNIYYWIINNKHMVVDNILELKILFKKSFKYYFLIKARVLSCEITI